MKIHVLAWTSWREWSLKPFAYSQYPRGQWGTVKGKAQHGTPALLGVEMEVRKVCQPIRLRTVLGKSPDDKG